MQTVLDVLVAARKLIEKPENWTQRWFARDVAGGSVSPFDPEATCWCSIGAMRKVAGAGTVNFPAEAALYRAVMHEFDCGVVTFNDKSTHDEVLGMFDRAIEAERAKVSA